MHINTESIIDTIPCYETDQLPERYNETFFERNKINNERKQ